MTNDPMRCMDARSSKWANQWTAISSHSVAQASEHLRLCRRVPKKMPCYMSGLLEICSKMPHCRLTQTLQGEPITSPQLSYWKCPWKAGLT
eukprot:14505373-Heterocapsa_arctica.AAC.1